MAWTDRSERVIDSIIDSSHEAFLGRESILCLKTLDSVVAILGLLLEAIEQPVATLSRGATYLPKKKVETTTMWFGLGTSGVAAF